MHPNVSTGAVQVSPWAGIHARGPAKRTAAPPPGGEDMHGAPSRHGWRCASWPWRGAWAGQARGSTQRCPRGAGDQTRSHTEKGWAQFPEAGVSWLNHNSSGLVFMLWGSYAQRKGSAIHRKHHRILQTAHPCPSLPTVRLQRVLWGQTFL